MEMNLLSLSFMAFELYLIAIQSFCNLEFFLFSQF